MSSDLHLSREDLLYLKSLLLRRRFWAFSYDKIAYICYLHDLVCDALKDCDKER